MRASGGRLTKRDSFSMSRRLRQRPTSVNQANVELGGRLITPAGPRCSRRACSCLLGSLHFEYQPFRGACGSRTPSGRVLTSLEPTDAFLFNQSACGSHRPLMAHFFDVQALTQLLDDAERLVAQASAHERRLADLAIRMECDEGKMPAAFGQRGRSPNRDASAPTDTRGQLGQPSDLAMTVRDLCIAARDQRQIATALLRRVVGELALDLETKSPPTRVLVVDDSFDTCEMASMILEAAGFHVITASNGLEGVLAAHMAKPAIILMDIAMPILNGIEAARLLKASTATRALHLIAYTAEPNLHDLPLTPLFVEVLSKPSNAEAIVTSVNRYLGQRGASPA